MKMMNMQTNGHNGEASLSEEALKRYAFNMADNITLLYADSSVKAILVPTYLDYVGLVEDKKLVLAEFLAIKLCENNGISYSKYLGNFYPVKRTYELLANGRVPPVSSGSDRYRVIITRSSLINIFGDVFLAGKIETALTKYHNSKDVCSGTAIVEIKNTALDTTTDEVVRSEDESFQHISAVIGKAEDIIRFYDMNICCDKIVLGSEGFHLRLHKTMKVTNYTVGSQ